MKQTIAFVVIVIVFLLPVEALAVSDHIEYNIAINKDSSATWKIIQVTDIDSTVDSWEEFEQRLLSTIETARERVPNFQNPYFLNPLSVIMKVVKKDDGTTNGSVALITME